MALLLAGYSGEALEKLFRDTFDPCTELIAMAHELRSYADLLKQIHNDLRIQHPEWIQQDGKSPMCDSYEERLIELLDTGIGESQRNFCSEVRCGALMTSNPTEAKAS